MRTKVVTDHVRHHGKLEERAAQRVEERERRERGRGVHRAAEDERAEEEDLRVEI